MTFLKMQDLPLTQKRVLIRADLNVPIEQGRISNDARIRAVLPTLKLALEQNARVLLISHLGRPKEGVFDPVFSLEPVAKHLSYLMKQSFQFNQDVRFEPHWLEDVEIEPGEIVLGENVRFNKGEEANDPQLAKKMAALCDIFVMDAFGAAHRAHASTVGVAEFAKTACAGLLLTQELEALSRIFHHPKHPVVAVVGGAKVSSKLSILKSLLQTVDTLIVGGGIANTFLKAEGYFIGDSLYEEKLIPQAKLLIKEAKSLGKTIVIPEDVVVAKEISENAHAEIKNLSPLSDHHSGITSEDKILDVGPKTRACYAKILKDAATIIWNGPVGVFELKPFEQGTRALANAIADSSGFSVAGGGETLAAIEAFQLADKISYISTGGGAFLECLEGKTLPAVQILEERCSK